MRQSGCSREWGSRTSASAGVVGDSRVRVGSSAGEAGDGGDIDGDNEVCVGVGKTARADAGGIERRCPHEWMSTFVTLAL